METLNPTVVEALLARLNDRITEMIDALSWYANDENYAGEMPNIGLDCGHLARTVLHQSLMEA